jgi:hypothetical protein
VAASNTFDAASNDFEAASIAFEAASNAFDATFEASEAVKKILNNQVASKANRGIYSSNLHIPGGGIIFLPSAKKWEGLFVL